MDLYFYLALYAVLCIISGVWSEYRYKKGVEDGNDLLKTSPDFKKVLSQMVWEEQLYGARQMINLLTKKNIIKLDEKTGIVYGIADSSYDVRTDEDAKRFLNDV